MRNWLVGSVVVLAGICFAGCGNDDGKIEYGQEFTAPEGAKNYVNPDAGKSREQLRQEDIEESNKEVPSKGKRRR